jgi:hypothetical protein
VDGGCPGIRVIASSRGVSTAAEELKQGIADDKYEHACQTGDHEQGLLVLAEKTKRTSHKWGN